MKKVIKTKRAFTLIELLVVVLIIGILAAIAMPQYTKAVEKARATEIVTLMENIITGERLHYMGTGGYATLLDELDIEVPNINENQFETDHFSGSIEMDAETGDVRLLTSRQPNGEYSFTVEMKVDGTITRSCNPNTVNICSAFPNWPES